jgi:uncharacterized delta-60 repeat protein
VGERVRRSAVGLLVACLLLGFGASPAGAAPADLDRSFGVEGIVAVEPPGSAPFSSYTPMRMATGLEDEIFVLYSTVGACPSFDSCQVEWSLLRYDRDGDRDEQFAVGGNSSLAVKGIPYRQADLAVGPDGKPVVAAIDGGEVVVARFDRAGHLDGSFGGAGRVSPPRNVVESTAGTPPVVAVQADGKVVVAFEGTADFEGGTGRIESGLILARFNADGTPDPGFGLGGVSAVKLDSQSRPAGLLVGPTGGLTTAVSECCRGEGGYGAAVGFARFLTGGVLDAGFAGDGHLSLPTGQPSIVRAIAPVPGGGVLAALDQETSGAVIVKLAADGNVDRGFGVEGGVLLSRRVGVIAVRDLVAAPRGEVVGVGWAGAGLWVFRLKPNGGRDRTFNAGRALKTTIGGGQETGAAVVLQSSGRIVALGEPTCCSPQVFAIVRLVGGSDFSRCLKRKATIVGTRRADEIVGTPHRDVIAALAGKDEVRGLSGPDVICGGKGRDTLMGGPGRDEVRQ